MADDGELEQLQEKRSLDRRSLIVLYDEFHEPLYRYVYRQTQDVEISRDLVADVFKRLLQAAGQGRGPERSAKSWLYRAAHNAVIDHYRAQQSRRHLPLDEEIVASGKDPAILAEDQLTAELVISALNHLTPEQHQVITLKFLAGFSNQEVAAVLAKPVGAVKSLQFRALAALRRRLIPAKEKAN